jgi:acetyl esterase/lipase
MQQSVCNRQMLCAENPRARRWAVRRAAPTPLSMGRRSCYVSAMRRWGLSVFGLSPRLRMIALGLRLFSKPLIARATDLAFMRARLERLAPRMGRSPAGARFDWEDGAPAALWTGPRRDDRAILYLHGGGFVMGSPNTHRHLAAHLARAAGAPAVMVRYRLAPEHPHPAQLDDMLAVYRRLLARGMAVAAAGDSAGGGLAFALTLAAREAGLPDPVCVVGFSPWCDMTLTSGTLTANRRRDAMLPLNRVAEVVEMRMGAEGDPHDPLASPVLARFQQPPPPAMIFASRAEILAGDAEAMAAAWRAGGGTVAQVWRDAAPHAWPVFAGVAPEATADAAQAGRFIAEAFGD